jgi:hypothetical protein
MKRSLRACHLVCLVLCLLVGSALRVCAQDDPGAPGPYAVARDEYDLGNTAFTPPGFPGPVELTASVHAPEDLSGGPFPLVVFLHGRHTTTYDPKTNAAFIQWPPSPGRLPIPSYIGYDYVAEVLASHGYIVVSISANGINARDNMVADAGMLARAQLIQRHLDLWNAFNTEGAEPFGDRFVGKVDLSNIGTMGHSRGGEGVVRHFVLNESLGAPYTIKAVLPLAPVDFLRFVVNNAPLAVMLPYADGDVSDLQGVHYFDDARYNVPGDPAPKHVITVLGANHNFFNTIWTPGLFPAGTADDWLFVSRGSVDPFAGPTVPGNGRLSPAGQRGTLLAYLTAFFRAYLGGETQFLPLLKGDAPPPPSATTDDIFFMYHAPDDPASRRDVNRLLDETNLAINTLGGAVTQFGINPYDLCGGEPPQPQFCLPGQPNARQPHTTPSARAPARRGLSQLRLAWDEASASYQNELPEDARDVSGYYAFQFRAGVNFVDQDRNTEALKDFSVTLVDGAGNTASTPVSRWSEALFYPPGKYRVLPRVLLHTIRIPLSAFTGVDLTDIRSVRFDFDQQARGFLLVSDLLFSDPAPEGTGKPVQGLSLLGRDDLSHDGWLYDAIGDFDLVASARDHYAPVRAGSLRREK